MRSSSMTTTPGPGAGFAPDSNGIVVSRASIARARRGLPWVGPVMLCIAFRPLSSAYLPIGVSGSSMSRCAYAAMLKPAWCAICRSSKDRTLNAPSTGTPLIQYASWSRIRAPVLLSAILASRAGRAHPRVAVTTMPNAADAPSAMNSRRDMPPPSFFVVESR
ncbi:MAG: hypothetical protein BWY06_02996 [Candidatus Latescibacteria bacterium ADurb.Bin168]|nr:MAG: hypothetical protein BWY06_02996 [Candidatus Latescibacteria bacterium ADurb.Bin168]